MTIFSVDDLKRLLISKQRKIFRWSLLCGAAVFLSTLCNPQKYEAWATFKQSTSRMDQSFDLKNLIRTFSSGGSEGSAITLMLSDTVLGKTVEKIGLQAQIKMESRLSRLFRKIGGNIFSEIGFRSRGEDAPRFSSVHYAEDYPLFLTLQRISDTRFSLFDKNHTFLTEGVIGQPLTLDNFQLTVDYLPPALSLLEEKPLLLQPFQSTIQELRSKITIKPSRQDKSLLLIRCQDTDRKCSAEIVNTLMAMYEKYLIEENKIVIDAQLSYLRQRQEELSAKLDQDIQYHAQVLKHNLQSTGFLGIKDEIEFILEPLQTHQLRLEEVEIELRQIEQRLPKTIDTPSFISSEPKLVERYSNLLTEQISSVKELLQQIHRKEPMTLPSSLGSLEVVAQEFNQALQALKLSNPPSEESFIHKQQEVKTVLQDLLHHLASRKNYLHQENALIEPLEADLASIRLDSAHSLFDRYSQQFDDLYAQLKQVIFIRDHLFDPHFEISTLSNVLRDPMTEQMIQRSSELEAQLCDDLNRSSKDRQRLKTVLMIHKRFLESHLDQTLQLGKLRIELIREKLSSLYNVMKGLLQQEKNVLEEKISELKQSMQTLPDLWVHENRLKFKANLTKAMMEGLVHIAETKNLSHYLYQVESRPLDKAKPPLACLHPLILAKSILTWALSACLFAFLFFIRSLKNGLPASLTTLKELGAHISGPLSLSSPLQLHSLQETDQETLRKLVAFLLVPDHKKIVASLGERQTNFFPALTALLKKYHRTSCVIDCSFGKIVSQEEEKGLLQVLHGDPLESSLRSYDTYHFLPVGGASTESVELLKSRAFHTLLQELSHRYDHLFLISKTFVGALESEALLQLCDASIVVVEGSLDAFQHLLNPSRQENNLSITLVQYPVLIEP